MNVKARYFLRGREPLRSVFLNNSRWSSAAGSSCDSALGSCADASSSPCDAKHDLAMVLDPIDLVNATLLHDRCMLTHEKQPSSSIEPTHVLALERLCQSQKFGSEQLLKQLSHVWGFGVGSGERWQPDTSTNVMPLMTRWRRSFADAEWMLLPQLDVLDQIFKSLQKNIISGTDTSFPLYTAALVPSMRKYHFVPINPKNCMPDPDYIISRRRWSNESDATCHSYQVFQSPFDDLVVESHIHPYMAIADVMLKLPDLCDGGRIPNIYQKIYQKTRFIWTLWMSRKIPNEPSQQVLLHTPSAGCQAPLDSGPSQSSGSCRVSTPSSTSSISSNSSKRKASDEESFDAFAARTMHCDYLSDTGLRNIGDDDSPERPYSRMPYLNTDASPSNSVWNLPIMSPTSSKRALPADCPQSPDHARSIAAWVARSARPPKRARRTSPPPLPQRKSLDEPVRAAPAGDWTKWTPEWPAWVAKDRRIAKAFAAEGVVRPSSGRGARRRPLGDT